MTQNAALAAAIAAAKQAEDQTQVTAGPGFEPLAAGPCYARLVSYLELGKSDYDYRGQKKTKNNVRLVFELFGKKHAPTILKDDAGNVTGTIPKRITVNINKSFGENGNWHKLMARLNWAKDITHAAEALGRAFKLTIVHVADEKKKDVIYANVTDSSGTFLIDPPRREIDEDGEIRYETVAVPDALTPLKLFLWDFPDMDQWNSIFIDGTYAEKKDAAGNVTAPAKSKNSIQEAIKAATNYVGSPIFTLLASAGDELDIKDDPTPPRKEADIQKVIETKAGASAADVDPLDDL
jgi:hypothetical protein